MFTPRRFAAGAAGVAVATVALAGCGVFGGGSSSNDSTPAPKSSSASATPTGSASGGGQLTLIGGGSDTGGSSSAPPSDSGSGGGANGGTDAGSQLTIGQEYPPAQTMHLTAMQTKLGSVVTDGSGRSLYRFDEDTANPSKSNCVDDCAVTWPPLTVQPDAKVYLRGVATDAVHAVARPDGTMQLTVGGWPVYYFSGDHKPGDQNGQGVKGTWYAVTPAGKKAGAGTSTPPSTAAGSNAALTLQKSSAGSVVATGSGQTVYVNANDSANPPAAKCTGGCMGNFAPVPPAKGATAIPGVSANDIGTVARPDGSMQMTLDGFPLYTNKGDQQPGDVSGKSQNGWYAVALDADKTGQ